jgi:hypothetical protein
MMLSPAEQIERLAIAEEGNGLTPDQVNAYAIATYGKHPSDMRTTELAALIEDVIAQKVRPS